jgi:hypothetical protein
MPKFSSKSTSKSNKRDNNKSTRSQIREKDYTPSYEKRLAKLSKVSDKLWDYLWKLDKEYELKSGDYEGSFIDKIIFDKGKINKTTVKKELHEMPIYKDREFTEEEYAIITKQIQEKYYIWQENLKYYLE